MTRESSFFPGMTPVPLVAVPFLSPSKDSKMTIEDVIRFIEEAAQEDLFEIAFAAADEFNANAKYGSLTRLNVVIEQRKF